MSGANVSLSLSAVNRTSTAFRQTRNEINSTKRAVSGMSGMMLSNRRAVQQAGMQLSDFAVQVGGGQSAILALTQQLPQFVQGFGAVGGVLAAVITIAGTLTLIMTKTGTSIAQITPLAGALQSEFTAMAGAMSWIKETAIDMANVLVNSLDTVFAYAALLAGFFLGKWVRSFIAARAASWAFIGGMRLTRAALIAVNAASWVVMTTWGLFAKVVVAATLAVEYMMVAVIAATRALFAFRAAGLATSLTVRLFTAAVVAGNLAVRAMAFGVAILTGAVRVSAAMVILFSKTALLGLVRALSLAKIATFTLAGALTTLRGAIMLTGIGALIIGAVWLTDKFLDLVEGAGGFGNALVLLAAVAVEAWGRIADGAWVIVLRMKSIANRMVAVWFDALSSMQDKWAKFLKIVAGAALKIPGMKGWGYDIAFQAGIAGQGVDDLNSRADEFRDRAGNLSDHARMLSDSLGRPFKSIQALRDAMDEANKSGIDLRDVFKGMGDDKDGKGGTLSELQDRIKSLADTIKSSMSDAFMSMVEGTKSVSDAFRDMARSIIKKLFDILVVQRLVGDFDVKTNTGTGLSGMLMKGLGSIFGGFRANGGPVSSGKAYVVGERGPAPFIPSRGGTIMPNGAGGGSNVTVNYHFQGGVTQADLASALPVLVERTKQEVVDAVQRGGNIARQFR